MADDTKPAVADTSNLEDNQNPPPPIDAPDPHAPLAAARLAGYSWPEIHGHIQDATDAALGAGYSQEEVDAHRGYQDDTGLLGHLWRNIPQEPPQGSPDAPTPIDPALAETYARAIQDGTTKDPGTFTSQLALAWGMNDPDSQAMVQMQLPHPEDLIDRGIQIAHSIGDPIVSGALAVKDNLLNLFSHGDPLDPKNDGRTLNEDKLIQEALAKPGAFASASDARAQEAAAKEAPTLQQLQEKAGRDVINNMTPQMVETAATSVKMATTVPLAIGKGLLEAAWASQKYWDDRINEAAAGKPREGTSLMGTLREDPGFNSVADIVVQGVLGHGVHLASTHIPTALSDMWADIGHAAGSGENFVLKMAEAVREKLSGKAPEPTAEGKPAEPSPVAKAMEWNPSDEELSATIQDQTGKLKDKLDASTDERERTAIQEQINRNMGRVQDLEKRIAQRNAGPKESTSIRLNGITYDRLPEESTEDFLARVDNEREAAIKENVDKVGVHERVNMPDPVPPTGTGITLEAARDNMWQIHRDLVRLGKGRSADGRAMMDLMTNQKKEDLLNTERYFKEMEEKPPEEWGEDTKAFYERNKSLFDKQQALRKEKADLLENPEMQAAAENQHVTKGFVKRIEDTDATNVSDLSGTEADPVTGFRPRSRGLNRGDAMEDTHYLSVLEDSEGNRVWHGDYRDTHPSEREPGNTNPIEYGDKVKRGDTTYTIKPARTEEIEKNTDKKFSHDIIGATSQDVHTLQGEVAHLKYLQKWGTKLKDGGGWVPDGTKNIPEGWVKIDIPQIKGWAHPKIARPLNDYWQTAMQRDPLLSGLGKINHYVTGSMFINPLPHLKNEGAHYFPSRGLFTQWLNPIGYGRFLYHLARASKSIFANDHAYQEYSRISPSSLYNSSRTRGFVAMQYSKALQEMAADKSGLWGKLAYALNYKSVPDMIRRIWGQSNRALWYGSEAFKYARTLEHMDGNPLGFGKGRQMSLEEAIARTHRDMPAYDVGPEVMKSEALASLLKSQYAMIFGRYRHGQISSIYNMVEDIVGPGHSIGDRAYAVDKALSFAVMYYAMGSAGYAGGASVIHHAQQAWEDVKNWPALVNSVLTLHPAITFAVDTLRNMDHYGNNIWERKGDTLENVVRSAKAVLNGIPIAQMAGEAWSSPMDFLKKQLTFAKEPKAVDPKQQAKWDARDRAKALKDESKDDFTQWIRNMIGEPQEAPLYKGGEGNTREVVAVERQTQDQRHNLLRAGNNYGRGGVSSPYTTSYTGDGSDGELTQDQRHGLIGPGHYRGSYSGANRVSYNPNRNNLARNYRSPSQRRYGR